MPELNYSKSSYNQLNYTKNQLKPIKIMFKTLKSKLSY